MPFRHRGSVSPREIVITSQRIYSRVSRGGGSMVSSYRASRGLDVTPLSFGVVHYPSDRRTVMLSISPISRSSVLLITPRDTMHIGSGVLAMSVLGSVRPIS